MLLWNRDSVHTTYRLVSTKFAKGHTISRLVQQWMERIVRSSASRQIRSFWQFCVALVSRYFSEQCSNTHLLIPSRRVASSYVKIMRNLPGFSD